MEEGTDEKAFINELKTRNGNLTIMLSEMPLIIKYGRGVNSSVQIK